MKIVKLILNLLAGIIDLFTVGAYLAVETVLGLIALLAGEYDNPLALLLYAPTLPAFGFVVAALVFSIINVVKKNITPRRYAVTELIFTGGLAILPVLSVVILGLIFDWEFETYDFVPVMQAAAFVLALVSLVLTLPFLTMKNPDSQ